MDHAAGPAGGPALGPVGMPPDDGVVGEIVGDALGAGAERASGAAPQLLVASGRRSENPPRSPNPPRPPRDEPRAEGTKPLGPDGGTTGDSLRLPKPVVLLAGGGDLAGAVKFLVALGPLGGRKPVDPRGGDVARAGPRGGDRGRGDLGSSGRCKGLAGERSRGVVLAESLKGIVVV